MAELTVSAHHVEYVFMEDGPRTKNNSEGWHNKVKKVTGKSHLNIFEKVEVFKLQLKVSLRQLMAGGALRSILPKQRTKDKELRRNLTMETTH